MATRRLVTFAGTRPAVGKTTLARSLAGALPATVFIDELVVLEDPMFAGTASGFRTKDYPSANDLLDGWARLLASHQDALWIINDGSWVALGEDLPWAQASWDEVVGYARRLLTVARQLDPLVFFLNGDHEQAYRRHVERDGRSTADDWVRAMHRLPTLTGDAPVMLAARLWRILDESGWPIIDLDATQPADAVLRDALAALGRH